MPVKILVIQTAFIGDAILTLPLIQKIKERNKNFEITVLAIPSTREIFLNSPSVENVLIIDKRNHQKGFFSFLKFCFLIRKMQFDVIYSPHRSARTSLMVLFSNSKKKIGFNTSVLSSVYSTRIKYDKNEHEVKRNLSLYDDKIVDWKVLPELTIDSSEKQKVVSFLNQIKKKEIICVAPGSVWETKKYPLKHFAKLIKMLVDSDFTVFLIGGEKDKVECDYLTSINDKEIFNLAGMFSIPETVEILKSCKAIISNDSAPTHMGVAANLPVLTIYCSTVPEFGFYPYNEKSVFIGIENLSCKPCGIHGHKKCPEKHFNCGDLLSPELIFEKIKKNVGKK